MGYPTKMATEPPYYPIHKSVKDLLHKDYVEFYNRYLINCQQAHLQPIEVTRSGKGGFGASPALPVGNIQELYFKRQETRGPDVRIRCFTPDGPSPSSGWPVMLYLHGGGWVLGDIDSENNVCTQMCVRSSCVVITTDYRLAPENPFPAAVHDAWESLLWTNSSGARLLNLDTTKIAIGGSSAGANLAAVIANKSTTCVPHIKIASQLLIVPIVDNTASPCNNPTYSKYQYTASLSVEKMLWYRNHYLPNHVDRYDPDASPLFFLTAPASSSCSGRESSESQEVLSSITSAIPPALIITGGCDILRHEGELYGRLLQEKNVPAQVHTMQGMPHPFLALDAVLEAGRTTITLLCEELNRVFR